MEREWGEKGSNNFVATKVRDREHIEIFTLQLVNNVWWRLKVEEVLSGSKELSEPFEAGGRDNESLRAFIVKLF